MVVVAVVRLRMLLWPSLLIEIPGHVLVVRIENDNDLTQNDYSVEEQFQVVKEMNE